MNAPPNIDSVTTHFDSDVVHWLANDTRDERFIDNIFAELCVRLQRMGIPVKRASLHLLIYHPQWLGARIMWADGMREAEMARVDYDVRGRSEYVGSPASEIYDGATEVRENLERDPSLGRKHAVYDEMRAKGLTDYVAWPLYHTLGKRHMVTFATDRPGGFDDAHIAGLSKLLPILALVSEIRMKNRLARTLLETYVGSHAGELILAGATRRGSGTTVRAAIMICDLRDFTRISDNWPRDDVIDLLNARRPRHSSGPVRKVAERFPNPLECWPVLRCWLQTLELHSDPETGRTSLCDRTRPCAARTDRRSHHRRKRRLGTLRQGKE